MCDNDAAVEVHSAAGAVHESEDPADHHQEELQGTAAARALLHHPGHAVWNRRVLLRVRQQQVRNDSHLDMVGYRDHDNRWLRGLLPGDCVRVFGGDSVCHVRHTLPVHARSSDRSDLQ